MQSPLMESNPPMGKIQNYNNIPLENKQNITPLNKILIAEIRTPHGKYRRTKLKSLLTRHN